MPAAGATPEVLFVCVHNAGRSQMAAAFLDRHASGRVTYSVSAVVLSMPLARLPVVLSTLTPAPPSARAGAVASMAAPFAARPIRRKALKRPTRVAIASVARGSPASSV